MRLFVSQLGKVLTSLSLKFKIDCLTLSLVPNSPTVYNAEDDEEILLRTFPQIHQEVQVKLRHTSENRTAKEHKSVRPVSFEVCDAIMVQTPQRHCKHSPKLTGSYKITHDMGGYKYRVFDRNSFEVVHSDRLKKTAAEATAVASPPGKSSSTALSSSTTEPQFPVTLNSASSCV